MILPVKKFSTYVTGIGLLAIVLSALCAVNLSAQTALQSQLVLRPMNQDDITLYKLPSTTEFSGGLSTIGIGSAVYLEAQLDLAVPASQIASVTWAITDKPAGSKAVLTDSPLGPNVGIYEPSDR